MNENSMIIIIILLFIIIIIIYYLKFQIQTWNRNVSYFRRKSPVFRYFPILDMFVIGISV